MVKKTATTSKSTPLFDIRLSNLDHDVLVLKGTEQEAASVLLAGKIVLSVNEPLTIKKLSLKLQCNLRLRAEIARNGKVPAFQKTMYEHCWDSQEFSKYLSNMYENSLMASSSSQSSAPPVSRNQSTTSLKGLGYSLLHKTSSSTSLLHSAASATNLQQLHPSSSTTSLSKSSHHVLSPGNYEIPFSAILPGNIPESIEGLPGCSSSYKLEATIDRGKFHSSLVAKKHVWVIRTLTTDAVELSETSAVDNTWPQKVEYSLSCPSKALAIGAGTPISMMFVPLLKGLKLGDIKIELVESYGYVGYIGPSHSAERVIARKSIPKKEEQEGEEEEDGCSFDKWEVDTFLRLPVSLSKCCQDVELNSHVKVRHKLKFNIGLINPDGHVSELRATLPIQLFISPFVSVSSRIDEEPNSEDEEVLFISSRDSCEALNSLANNPSSNNNSHTSLTGLVAPPLYEKHVYDRLWSDVSPVETPITSGASTPRNNFLHNNNQFSMSCLDSNLLAENLQQLSMQRQAQSPDETNNTSMNLSNSIMSNSSGSSTPLRIGRAATFNLDGGDEMLSKRTPSSWTPQNQSFLNDAILTPPVHLSRANSELLVNADQLNKVPTYSQAMKSNTDDDLSPAYEPPLPGSNINLQVLGSNKLYDPRRMPNSRGGSSSPPIQSRNASSNNLTGLLMAASGGGGQNKKSFTNLSEMGGSPPTDRLFRSGSPPTDRLFRTSSSLSLQFKKKK
ncbi:creD [[Candida] subhashii]|uniref:CreD n=1 Tax=[Candida] subhashii TaxID=561895 RepID=A0A8J5QGV5_9ASCO|nr:creD [[Candida] subhashii]KAG7665519.1 creD [[Candida] subhashii]